MDSFQAREWLVGNVNGLGYKEASHFLRNVGFEEFAILDRHILRVLEQNGLITELPKHLGKEKYLRIEAVLGRLCKKTSSTQAELDLYLWYIETGTVLK